MLAAGYDSAALAAVEPSPSDANPQAVVAAERVTRPRAGWAALGAATALVGGLIANQIVQSGSPKILLTDALRDAAGERPLAPPRSTLLGEQLQYRYDNFALELLGMVLVLMFVVLVGFVLRLLYDAVRAREAEIPGWLGSTLLTAVTAFVIGSVVQVIAVHLSIGDFLDGAGQTSQDARDAIQPMTLAAVLGLFGNLGLVVTWVMISLFAMRAGLLTRFLGVLGMIAGFGQLLGLTALIAIQVVWLVFLGLTLLGRAPSGTPPAWTSGTAVPWPSAAEARRLAAERLTGQETAGEVAGADFPASGPRKRKRRGR